MLVELSLLGLLLVLLYIWNRDPPGMPPGPSWLRMFNVFNLVPDDNMRRSLRDSFGDIMRVRIGSLYAVHLFNYKTIREAYSKTEFSDRPSWKAFHFLSDGEETGIVFSNGKEWQHSRRFLLRELRDMGMGKTRLDDAILIEAQALVEDFRRYINRPSRFPPSINIAVLNVIWQLVASRRYGLHDEEIIDFMKRIRDFQELMPRLLLPEFFSCFKYLPKNIFDRLFGFTLVQKMAVEARRLMMEVIDEHKSTLDSNNPRDVIDAYLLAMEANKDDPDSLYSEGTLIRNIFDLFAAGSDTTSNMIRWVLLYMADNPEVQKKVQRQIDEVVDREVLPSHLHRSRLPYLDATLQEVLRLASLISDGVPHVAASDTHLEGYFIPKGCSVNTGAYVIHTDTRYWDDPMEFKPERFIDESGSFTTKKEGFIPFGIVKRSCLGEALARMELFLFSGALLQNFFFAPPENSQVDMQPDPLVGSRFPKDQELLITIRE